MNSKLILSALIILLSLGIRGNVITTKDFAAEMKSNKELIVLDVLAADVYAKQHIKGAINIPHKELYKAGGYEGQLKEVSELAKIFGDKGISVNSKVVIYDDGSQKYNSRVWWILKYLGATDVSLLHKDMSELEQSRIPLTNVPVVLKASTFIPSVKESMNVQISELKDMMGKPEFKLLDAREKDEFEGADKDKRSKGHLPGSVWMNFKEVLNPSGDFKTKEEILEVASKYGITQDQNIVVYCQTGIKAATLYIGLHEIAGISNVKLYAGAYAEWAADPGNQLVK